MAEQDLQAAKAWMGLPNQIFPDSWEVRVRIPAEIMPVVRALPYVEPHIEDFTCIHRDSYMLGIDARFDIEQAWQSLFDTLTSECIRVFGKSEVHPVKVAGE